jgi:stearoyl-CoA desaturase (delta-9 desaturase)
MIFATSVAAPGAGVALGVVLGPPSFVDVALFSCLFVSTVAGIEVGYHRLLAHGSFETTRLIRTLFAIAGAMAVQGPATYWVSHHRRHHQYADREGDPHSPHTEGGIAGFCHAHLTWFFGDSRAYTLRYARDLLQDRALVAVERLYFVWVLTGLALPAAAGFIATWSGAGAASGFIWGGLVRIFVVQHGTYGINSLCHLFGRRPFDTRDESRNVGWLAPITFGGSLHNTHHAFPTTARNSIAWYEVDPGYWLIAALESVGCAWNVKLPAHRKASEA